MGLTNGLKLCRPHFSPHTCFILTVAWYHHVQRVANYGVGRWAWQLVHQGHEPRSLQSLAQQEEEGHEEQSGAEKQRDELHWI